jgi:SAM-dependent methyltransferase
VPSSVDLEKPSAARMYDYLLGGNHNFEVDREFSGQALKIQPQSRRIALSDVSSQARIRRSRSPCDIDSLASSLMNRAFLRRAVLFMVENGVRQFLDLGSGIPTVGNVHEIAQAADPGARIVYVDNEHVAVEHSRVLLEGNENAAMVHADITKPGLVLGDPATRQLLDFSQPIGLLAITIGHYILDKHDPVNVYATYRDVLAPGSYLALTHLTSDFAVIKRDEVTELMKRSQNNIKARTRAEVLEFVGDFELVEPGLVTTSTWRPERDEDRTANPEEDALYAGVARKG